MRGGVAVPEEMSPKGLKIFSRVLESVVRATGTTTTAVTLTALALLRAVHGSSRFILTVTP